MLLEKLADITAGQSPKGSQLNEERGTEFHQGKTYFGETDLLRSPIKTTVATKLAKAGDVLICVRAPVGDVNALDREICIGRGLAALTPKLNVPSRFLLHLLRYHNDSIKQSASGSTYDSITSEQLKTFDLPVPNPTSWLRISNIIGGIVPSVKKRFRGRVGFLFFFLDSFQLRDRIE